MLRVLSWLTPPVPKRPMAALALSVAAVAGQLHAADMTTPARPFGAARPAQQYSGTQAYGQAAYAPRYGAAPRTPASSSFGGQHYNQQKYLNNQLPAATPHAASTPVFPPNYSMLPRPTVRGMSPYSFAGTPLANTAPAATNHSASAPPKAGRRVAPVTPPPATITASVTSPNSELRRMAPLPAAKPASVPSPTPVAAPATANFTANSPAIARGVPPAYFPPPYFAGVYSPYAAFANSQSGALAAPPRRPGSSLNSLASFDNNLVQMDQLEPLPEDEEPSTPPENEGRAPPTGITGNTPADQVFGVAPPSNEMQFLRAVSVLLEPGERQLDVGFEYAITEGDNVGLFVIGNQLAVSEVNARRRLAIVPVELRYGLTENVQVFCGVPFGWSNAEVSFLGIDEFTGKVGLGDTNFGASVLLCDGGGNAADVVATLAVTAPTGDAEFPLLVTTPSSQLGEGYWAGAASVVCIKSYDPVVVFYGLGYRHRFDATFDTLIGPQTVDPGEQIIYQFGAGFAANETVTLSCNFVGMYISENYVEDVRVAGSILEPMQLRFAITCAQECKIVEPFAAIGMTDTSTSARVGITWTF